MIGDDDGEKILRQTRLLSEMLGVKGLLNVQFALRDGGVYVLEVNPRASRTIPFVSKATGIPWAKIAAKTMVGRTLKELGVLEYEGKGQVAVKTPVFPFMKFPNVQTYLGPEMRSTGEVMGLDTTFGGAFAKAQFGAGHRLPKKGNVFISVNDNDKQMAVAVARQLYELGFGLFATEGTYRALRKAGIPAKHILKVVEGRPNALDTIINGDIQFVINTPLGKVAREDEYSIGRVAMAHEVPCLTTLSASWAAVQAIRALQAGPLGVYALQDE
jgi:carbamoyl-phosphate synthase large subunit